MTCFLSTSPILSNANISWNPEKNLARFSQNDLQMESLNLWDWAIQDGHWLLLLKNSKEKKTHKNDDFQETLNESGPILYHKYPRVRLLQIFTN